VGNRLYKIAHFEDLNWMPLIKAVDLGPLNGDLNGEGSPFVLRLRCANERKSPRTGIRRMKTLRRCRAPCWAAWGKPSMKRSCKR
jgi:hypothetical protein